MISQILVLKNFFKKQKISGMVNNNYICFQLLEKLESQYERTGSRIGGKRVVGLIGYDLLKDFVVTLDYRYGKLHIALPQK